MTSARTTSTAANDYLAALIRRKRAGDRVRLKVLSNGKEKTVAVTLGEAK